MYVNNKRATNKVCSLTHGTQLQGLKDVVPSMIIPSYQYLDIKIFSKHKAEKKKSTSGRPYRNISISLQVPDIVSFLLLFLSLVLKGSNTPSPIP